MQLTPREKDKLLISMAAEVARKRLVRGVKLNYPEAIALITDTVVEGARDGRHCEDGTVGEVRIGSHPRRLPRLHVALEARGERLRARERCRERASWVRERATQLRVELLAIAETIHPRWWGARKRSGGNIIGHRRAGADWQCCLNPSRIGPARAPVF